MTQGVQRFFKAFLWLCTWAVGSPSASADANGIRRVLPSLDALTAAILVQVTVLVLGISFLGSTIRPLTTAAPNPPELPPDSGEMRFGLARDVRHRIFEAVARHEAGARRTSAGRFSGTALAWSAEDDRAATERKDVGIAARRYHVTLTQVYLVLDEGIREHWTFETEDGGAPPLIPTTVPLNPRRQYGW